MTPPRVSVLCLAYNQVDFLPAALDGILGQGYPNLEVVVADDGSTDGTTELARRYAAAHPEVVVADGPHVGITANSNRGLARCGGEFVALTAGDDILIPGKIARQVEWFAAGDRRVLCGHDVEAFDSDSGRTLFRWSERYPQRGGVGARGVVYDMPFCATSLMFRRSALPAYGFDARIPTISDWKLVIDCLEPAAEFGFVDGVWARYRRHPGNTTSGSDPARVDRIFAEVLMLAALVEAQYPHLAGVARRSRARHTTFAALRAAKGSDRRRAVAFARAALADAPTVVASVCWGVVRHRLGALLGRSGGAGG